MAFLGVRSALLRCRSCGRTFLYREINVKPAALRTGEEETTAPGQPAHIMVVLAQWSPAPDRQQGAETVL